MNRPELTYAEILKHSFPGKDAVEVAAWKLGSLDSIARVHEVKPCREFIRRYEGFLERTKPDTEHKSYVIAMMEQMLPKLRESPEYHCAVLFVPEEPNALYCVYYVVERNAIVGAVKGYEPHKTPEAEWRRLWGNEGMDP